MNDAERHRAWMDRYADCYSTDAQRREGYKANLATMSAVFDQQAADDPQPRRSARPR